jgi:hypothetical protein
LLVFTSSPDRVVALREGRRHHHDRVSSTLLDGVDRMWVHSVVEYAGTEYCIVEECMRDLVARCARARSGTR